MPKHFLSIADFSKDEILQIFDLTKELKQKQKSGKSHKHLEGKTLAMIFQKPSARTRVSFEVGMFQLGGHALYLGPNDIQIGQREAIGDVAQTLSQYVDIIMARLFGHEDIVELANHASVPVLNGLTDLLHPCQVMADVFTIFEKQGKSDKFKVAFIGDGNNVANSWINMAARIPMILQLGIPDGYDPDQDILHAARKQNLSEIQVFRDPVEAVKDADVIYTDVWASMGQESEAEKRKRAFKDYRVDTALVGHAKPDCLVMHCLPAHRGEEIASQVIDGPQSIVFEEAENRLHVQKAIMVKVFECSEKYHLESFSKNPN
ncbi:ornithine carbamoyltransferase [candidate division KSB1 bacterium]|nr:ornithine carbamoyltransferase [candidate division KSB1 bacterium]NIR68823.1 ornithine carbamoyltransferase [candidate division KSB1 bacterium]NIS27186.1 ornithine carbamoyltransferase [candidate division KSB1 bacterium]NIT74071.1 ornithine carbamoyltransferase [candidate division KSB1 bacterium]NIU26936.1 ornithine carbamoyltransferase [candidate division KSB1 bacterium]